VTGAAAAHLASTFVVLQPDQSAVPVALTPGIWQELDERFDNFKGRVLLSIFEFDQDWSTWERHPAGDEVVCLLSGRAVFHLEGGAAPLELKEPGSYVIVPKGTWHTAKTSVATRMLFVTPGEGTENRPI
jgi:quercetin dioxygenase-like cupin family protein